MATVSVVGVWRLSQGHPSVSLPFLSALGYGTTPYCVVAGI
ncbi:hypothetical protein CGRA01v4_04540 [Colletotrichum graminicola]|nr:hypothetical protein CGRA01v4_04540 [Colletotrichum graminicola]